MEAFCEENRIQVAHGSPRTPTTQGLVERSNRSWKEDMRALIMSTSSTSVQKWCEKASEAAYTRNISYHRAIKMMRHMRLFMVLKAIENVNIMRNNPENDKK